MPTTNDLLNMSDADLMRNGRITKQMLVDAFIETRKQVKKQTRDHPSGENSNDPLSPSSFEDLLDRRLDPISSLISGLNERIDELNSKLFSLQVDYDELQRSMETKEEEIYQEVEQRFRRRKYVVISGL